MRRLSLGALVMTIASVAALAVAPQAFAHAQLLGTSPQSGSTVPAQPSEVIFKFNQDVGGTLGAVRVYDAQGNEVDNLNVGHPDGQEHWMGVGLKAHLPDGTYTGTYRVISADTHIVYGGLVFNIGHAGAQPKFTVAGLIGRNESGEITRVAFGAVRALDYLSIALMLGGLAFLLIAWLSSLRALAEPDASWRAASRAFARRLQRLLFAAIVLGVVVSLLGFLLQGASAAGVSLWGSLKSTVLSNTLHSRFGEVWGARALDWLVIGGLFGITKALGREVVPTLTANADPPVLNPGPPRWIVALVGLGCAYLVITPALAGHASIEGPVWIFFPSDALHVLAASVWVGGSRRCCWLCRPPPASCRARREAACCWRRLRDSRPWRWAR